MLQSLPKSVLTRLLQALALGMVIVWAIWWWMWFPQLRLSDATTYLGAGERLNAGHQLYALVAGDRPIALNPPYWAVPILSPPLIGVIWRPLAAVSWGLTLWWIATASTLLVSLAFVARTPRGALLVILLSWAAGLELIQANLNTWILAGLLLVHARRDRPWFGTIVGVLAALKLTPVIVGLWMIRTRRWKMLAFAMLGGITAAALMLAGAGLDNLIAYLPVARDSHPAGLVAGFAPWAPYAVLGISIVGVFVLPVRWAWSAAIVGMVLGSPVVNISTSTILAAAQPTNGDKSLTATVATPPAEGA